MTIDDDYIYWKKITIDDDYIYLKKIKIDDDCIYWRKKIKFPIDLHIKAYHLNYWLLFLYGFKYLHYSVTLSSQV